MNAATLKTWRESVGLSATNLADLLGVETRSISRWEADTNTIPDGILAEIAKIDANITSALSALEARLLSARPPVLYRFRELDDLKTHERDLWQAGVTLQAHASVLWRVARQTGASIEWFDAYARSDS